MKDLLSLVIKTSTLAFRDFLFHFMLAYLPEKKNKKKNPGLFLRASVDLCSVIIVLVVQSFSLLTDK